MKMLFEKSSQVLGGYIRITSREPTFETDEDQERGKAEWERSRTQSKHLVLPSGTRQHASSITTCLKTWLGKLENERFREQAVPNVMRSLRNDSYPAVVLPFNHSR